ncbi:uncharacterized protein [Typha latifolia]|uniref:uncharacterized protein n=1 Tax=Typha latifolia TaxID=4733 RepID=UPI003C2C86DE
MLSSLPSRFAIPITTFPLFFHSYPSRSPPLTLGFPTQKLSQMATAAAVPESTATDGEPSPAPPAAASDVIVQYVVLRRDLIDTWPLGSIVTQGCHASVAAVWAHRDHPDTVVYCSPSNVDSMHKVTLEVKGEVQLRNLAEKLEGSGIAHKLWIEQPENIPTCLATRPCPKSQVASFFKKLKLCK